MRTRLPRSPRRLLLLLALAGLSPTATARAQTPPRFPADAAESLGREALQKGDPARGALVFFRPSLQCATCHVAAGGAPTLGPDLTTWPEPPTARHLVESILVPSKAIRAGYEPVTVATTDGRQLSGFRLKDGPDGLLIRTADPKAEPVRVAKDQIDEVAPGTVSLMPAGLVETLADRQEFLDLIAYLDAIAKGGPTRAKELQPPASALAAAPLPAYEADIDHAGLIAGLDQASFDRGRDLYNRVCANCHGNAERPGSLPTSRRFASEPMKNGADPYRLYRTLTDGSGQMAAQSWMVPRQKYDVIHYLREAYFKPLNPSQLTVVDAAYLAGLPKGTSVGPEASNIEPWSAMDYGPSLSACIEVGDDGANFAYKGIAVRLDAGPGGIARGRAWALFEHDTMRLAAFWTGDRFIDWNSIHFNGSHGTHPRVVGDVVLANPAAPGWADPATGSFDDPRSPDRDGKRHGPLPKSWLRFRGQALYGDRSILAYDVGTTPVLESPGLVRPGDRPILTRTFEVGPRDRELTVQVAHLKGGRLHTTPLRDGTAIGVTSDGGDQLLAGVSPDVPGVRFTADDAGNLRLTIPAGAAMLRFTLWAERAEATVEEAVRATKLTMPIDLSALTHGGPKHWPEPVVTFGVTGASDGPFAVDTLTVPAQNPWSALVRPTGFDFLPGTDGDQAAVCTWDGDVWTVAGLKQADQGLTWRRIASGLFQPLGLLARPDGVHVLCRDQLAILRDRNGDGETDFVECLNTDHQVTQHFHEFAMGLQADAEGNFYYTKAACHGLPAIVPQHGTLLRVSPDGERTDILATGFRAPNGVCLNPDGSFYVTDQEGFWCPKNRINRVVPGKFYGNLWGYTDLTDPSDSAMEDPLCWITNRFDRSPAEPIWVTPDAWGPLKGALLNLSYGYGKLYVILRDQAGARLQGGMVTLPVPQSPTGLIRGRFGPDGALYTCGMFAWAGNQTDPGGFYRVRPTGQPLRTPIGFRARRGQIRLTFPEAIDPLSVADPARFAVQVWGLRRSVDYGSPHLNEHPLAVRTARLLADGRTLVLEVPELAPTRGLSLTYNLKGVDGVPFQGEFHGTIYELPEPDGD